MSFPSQKSLNFLVLVIFSRENQPKKVRKLSLEGVRYSPAIAGHLWPGVKDEIENTRGLSKGIQNVTRNGCGSMLRRVPQKYPKNILEIVACVGVFS